MLDRQSLLAALAQLPPSQREAIVLCHVADHSTADAAAILGTSPAAVRSLCARGLETLRTLIPEVEHV